MSFEKLHLAFVAFSRFPRVEGSQIPAFAGGGVSFARIQAVFARFKFSYHDI
jgi:hypothetical protein